ncbi:hypothetical protein I3843_04G110100 [Carya illinoinensis]|uniref:Transmembrane protein n=1 Tax=Carya illinoinensis TaxID=32201 RepID=A0A8T1QUI1_CARIL|nr:hypothetical protein I3760_04G118600 [Carya illinoinensis]KAG6657873.1 hypothetical protein CIPAW_04G120100 [Carya illinoinensis]KAG6717790.1 hypothetical protein I3842_04G117800 [Carya illinoinensis]KAG7983512.1 hypothetical protein I3843_04G110100 [Carya illinoinensis]
MGRLGLVCFIMAVILGVEAMAEKSKGLESNPLGEEVQNKVGMLGVVPRVADQPASSAAESSEGEEDSKVAEAPSPARRLGKHHSDKSVAGGGVIIGGLVTVIFAAVFCYIRVTRRRNDVH